MSPNPLSSALLSNWPHMVLNLNPTDSEEEDAENWARWEAERVEELLAHENAERATRKALKKTGDRAKRKRVKTSSNGHAKRAALFQELWEQAV